ncbi:uncharacterized protein A4U43_C02F9370 [Asparagus officinalis]|uniref:Uncharacterized protein n=1 Tax=Asparagus officinalis TaxID=4686 RepID=A0A5P1FM52_ASPOF|nr:uncharacterized protein A4U43_C02F9370 [Asparagus officinalis]
MGPLITQLKHLEKCGADRAPVVDEDVVSHSTNPEASRRPSKEPIGMDDGVEGRAGTPKLVKSGKNVEFEGLHTGRATSDAGRIAPWPHHRRDHSSFTRETQEHDPYSTRRGPCQAFPETKLNFGNKGQMKEGRQKLYIYEILSNKGGILDVSGAKEGNSRGDYRLRSKGPLSDTETPSDSAIPVQPPLHADRTDDTRSVHSEHPSRAEMSNHSDHGEDRQEDMTDDLSDDGMADFVPRTLREFNVPRAGDWSGRDNTRVGGGGRFEVDQITALSAKLDAMQKAFDKMSVKAVNQQPQSCVMCGVEGHAYEQCPLAQVDGEIEQVNSLNNEPSYFPKPPFNQSYSKDPVEQQNWRWKQNNPAPFNNSSNPSYNNSFNNPSSNNNNRNFYQNAAFPNSNNRAHQSGPPKPYIAPAVSDFMHEQGKMNQMIFEQMQALNAQLAAQSKMMEQMGHQTASSQPQPGKLPSQPEVNPRGEAKAITLRSGAHYQGPTMPADQTAKHTDRADLTRTVSPLEEENPDRVESTRPAVSIENPVNTDRATDTRAVETSELESICAADAKTNNLEELGHGPDGSHTDRAPSYEGHENEEHGKLVKSGKNVEFEGLHTGRATSDAGRIAPWPHHRRDHSSFTRETQEHDPYSTRRGPCQAFPETKLNFGNKGQMKEGRQKLYIYEILSNKGGILDVSGAKEGNSRV